MKVNRLLVFAITLLLYVSATAHAQKLQWAFPGDRITFEQWTQYFDRLANTKGAILTEDPNFYIINLFSDPEHPAIYVFTKPTHPSYPAVVIRAVESDGGESRIIRHGHYAGDQAAFDKLWHEYDALDKKNIEDAK